MRYSTVCLDLDLDNYCQPSEPHALTDKVGYYSIDVTPEHQRHVNYKKALLLVYGGQDSDRPNEDFIGKLTSPNDGSGTINITPVTTLVSSYMRKDGIAEIDNDSIEKAKDIVASSLGIDVQQVGKDPRATEDKKLINATMQLQYAVTTIVNATGVDATKDKATKSQEIFTALASGLDNVGKKNSVSEGVASIIDNAPEVLLDKSAQNAKHTAKKSAQNIDTILAEETELKDSLTKIVVTQDKLLDKMQEYDFSDNQVEVDDIKYDKSLDFEKEAKKIALEDVGVLGLDDEILDKIDISLDTELEKLKDELVENEIDTTELDSLAIRNDSAKYTKIEDYNQQAKAPSSMQDEDAQVTMMINGRNYILLPYSHYEVYEGNEQSQSITLSGSIGSKEFSSINIAKNYIDRRALVKVFHGNTQEEVGYSEMVSLASQDVSVGKIALTKVDDYRPIAPKFINNELQPPVAPSF